MGWKLFSIPKLQWFNRWTLGIKCGDKIVKLYFSLFAITEPYYSRLLEQSHGVLPIIYTLSILTVLSFSTEKKQYEAHIAIQIMHIKSIICLNAFDRYVTGKWSTAKTLKAIPFWSWDCLYCQDDIFILNQGSGRVISLTLTSGRSLLLYVGYILDHMGSD